MSGFTATFSNEVTQLRLRIDASLDAWSQFDEGCPSRLQAAIRHSLLAPGKRLRPILVLSTAEACGASIDDALPAAIAVEMIHAYSLVHDDLPAMDDDLLRRGLPTCHAKFGEANAILAGDALQARAFEIIATKMKDASIAVRCCGELARAAGAAALVGGQFDDLDAEFKPGTIEQLQQIHRRKTGALLTVCMRMGGLIANVTDAQLLRLQKYGESLGLAFQIIDDLLDIDGDASTVGKELKKDAEDGKLTYPGLLGVAASKKMAAELVEVACEAVEFLDERGERLQQIARYVTERDH